MNVNFTKVIGRYFLKKSINPQDKLDTDQHNGKNNVN